MKQSTMKWIRIFIMFLLAWGLATIMKQGIFPLFS